jgi:pimeloyl-ACP methyl ester carboxylesterase
LAEYLCKTLHKSKVILVGHSWGSLLGVLMAKARPDLFYAYVGTGQLTDMTRNYTVALQDLLREARARGDKAAIEELRSIGPPPYPDIRGYVVQHKWASRYEHAELILPAMLGAELTAPGYSFADIEAQNAGMALSDQQLTAQILKLDSKGLGGRFAVPVFVFQGAQDFTSPTELARDFVASIDAPHKEFVAIPGEGHYAVFLKSDEFLRLLVTHVRRLSTGLKNSRGK